MFLFRKLISSDVTAFTVPFGPPSKTFFGRLRRARDFSKLFGLRWALVYFQVFLRLRRALVYFSVLAAGSFFKDFGACGVAWRCLALLGVAKQS